MTEPSANTQPSKQEIVTEGDIAADYLEELLDIADLEGDLDIAIHAGRAQITVYAEGETNLKTLAKPDTVSALQELTRLAVQNKTGRFSRLILDIGGSRDARAEELALLVEHAISRIEEGAISAALPPMTSYERKLVHDFVGEKGYVSKSAGEGSQRHPVITARS